MTDTIELRSERGSLGHSGPKDFTDPRFSEPSVDPEFFGVSGPDAVKISRRGFLKAAGVGALAIATACAPEPPPTPLGVTPSMPTPSEKIPIPQPTDVPAPSRPGSGGEYDPAIWDAIQKGDFQTQEDALRRDVQYWGSASEQYRPFANNALPDPDKKGQSASVHYVYIADETDPQNPATVVVALQTDDYPGYIILPPIDTANGAFMGPIPLEQWGHTVPDHLKPTFLRQQFIQEDVTKGVAPQELVESFLALRGGKWIRVDANGYAAGELNLKMGTWEAETTWITNEIIGFEENGAKASFGFELAADTGVAAVREFLGRWQEKLVQYAKDNNIPNPPVFDDFEMNPNNPEAGRNIAMTAVLGFLNTYNVQNDAQITLADFTAHPEKYPFKVWTADNQVTTLTLDQIKNIKLELISESVDTGSSQLYLHVAKASTYGLGYGFDGNTFTFFLPFDRYDISNWLTPDDQYPIVNPNNIRYLYPYELFLSYIYSASEMPFSAYQYDNGNRDMGTRLNAMVDLIRTQIADGAHYPGIDSPWNTTMIAPYKKKYPKNGVAGIADFCRTYGLWVAQ